LKANRPKGDRPTGDRPTGDRVEPVYGLARVIAYPLRPFFHIRRVGSRRVPRRGPVLLACNHISLLDPLVVLWLGECTHRKVRFLAMAELWENPALRFFLVHTRQIPVDRASVGALGSLESAAGALRDGECVAVFPEGEISEDLELMPGKTGIARLAASTGVPVTPMGVWGTQRVHAKGRPTKIPAGTALTIVVGAPITVAPDDNVFDATDRIMEAVAGCVATARAIYPQQPRGGEDSWWVRGPASAVMRPTKRERGRSRSRSRSRWS
jgi:1-acyl-sn-glycerol-3-phosphate acyltransferase